MKELIFDRDFIEDLEYWVRSERKIALKIFTLLDSIQRDPFQGIGKPEPLRHLGSSIWSRRINQEHRIVYRVTENKIFFVQARYHY